MKILIVEDEKKISDFMNSGLRARGFIVDVTDNGDDALILAMTQPYDAIVLDIMLPGLDGLSILRLIRKKNINTPVILLSARGDLDDRLTGLESGADDYMVKPFYVDELIARLHVITRRVTTEQMSLKRVGDLSLNQMTRVVTFGDQVVDLSAREFSLVEFLMRSPGRVYTRTQILEYVWNIDFDPSTNVVDVCIKRIRKKLNQYGAREIIETVRGVGYRITNSTAVSSVS